MDGVGRIAESELEIVSLYCEGVGGAVSVGGGGPAVVSYPAVSLLAVSSCPSCCSLAVWPLWKPSGCSFGRICPRELCGHFALVRKLLQIRT